MNPDSLDLLHDAKWRGQLCLLCCADVTGDRPSHPIGGTLSRICGACVLSAVGEGE